jgi:cation transport ATPase
MITGSILIALGLALALWVLFNLFIELQPEASRTSPAPAIFFSSALIAVGVSRATGGRWHEWRLWRDRRTYVVAAIGLIALGLAYLYNMLLRLQHGSRGLVTYIALAADLAFLLMCGRVLRWLARGRRSVGDGPDGT